MGYRAWQGPAGALVSLVGHQNGAQVSASHGPYEVEDAAAIALIAAMSVAPAEYYQQAIDEFIQALKTASIWTKFLGIYDLGGPTEADSKINFVSPGTFTATESGTVTWTLGSGMQSNGSDGYLDLGFAANNAALGQNDVGLHLYVNTSGVATAGTDYFAGNGTDNFRVGLFSTDGIPGRVNAANTVTTATAPSRTHDALVSIQRRISSEAEIWFDGVIATTEAANTSSTPSSTNFNVFRYGATPAFANPLTVIRMVMIGQALTGPEMVAFNGAVQAYVEATEPRYFLLITAGQSNIDRVFRDEAVGGSGDDSANSNAGDRILIPQLQTYLDTAFTGRRNVLQVVNGAFSGSSALGTTVGGPAYTWWNYETDVPGNRWAGLDASLAPIFAQQRPYRMQFGWAQGEADIESAVATWKEATEQIFAYARSNFDDADMPIVIYPLGPNTDYTSELELFRAAQAEIAAADADIYLGPSTMDIERVAPNDWHAVNDLAEANDPATGYDVIAADVALTTAQVWGA